MGHNNDDNGLEADDSTVQMDPDQVAQLHAALSAIDGGAAAKPPPSQPGTVRPPDRAASAAVPPKPAAKAAPKPAAKAAPKKRPPARPQASRGPSPAPFIIGGVGGILLALYLLLSTLMPLLRIGGEGMAIGMMSAGALGFILMGPGLSSASRLTSGMGIVAGIFAYLSGLALIASMVLPMAMRDYEVIQLVMMIATGVVGLTWLLIGIWGLTAKRGAGALGIVGGILALVGAAIEITSMLLMLTRSLDLELYFILKIASGVILLGAAVMIIIIMFGKLPKAARAAA